MSDNNASLLSLSANSVCLGTKRPIDLRRSESSNTSGMVATFSCQTEGNISTHHLLVLVTDGRLTFQGKIHPSEATKVSWHDFVAEQQVNGGELSDATKVKILSSFLLKDVDHIDVTYDYTAEEQQIKLSIKEKMSSTALTRVLGSHILEPVETNLSFAAILGTCINDSLYEIQQLQQEKESMRVDLLSWKDTAEKLDRDWQQEKDSLLDRFLELYKKAHGELGDSRLENQQLKRELDKARAMAASSAKKRQRPPPTPSYAALPDDHDEEQFSSEMIDMLAAGQPTRKPSSKNERSNGSSTAKATSSTATTSSSVGAMRLNPHTGAKEVYDFDAFLDQASQEAALDTNDTKDTAVTEANESESPQEANENDRPQDESNQDDPMAIAAKLFNKKKTNDDNNNPSPAKRARRA